MVEFRLYYDDKGNVICYTCDELEGNYIVIDSETFAQCRHDVKVVDGEIVSLANRIFVSKMVLDNNGTSCAVEDICIIVDDSYSGEILNWEVKTYEFRNS